MQENQSLTTAGFPQLSFPEHEQLRCPRCDSANTKFCYYNNYNLSQPRHFCKNCRRYWTKGGTLRNIPVGGGCRKNNKRPAAAAAASIPSKQQQQRVVQNPSASTVTSSGTGSGSGSQNLGLKPEPGPTLGEDVGKESFTSLLGLASNGQFGNFLEGFGQNGVKFGSLNRSGQNTSLEGLQGSGISSEGFMISEVQNGSEPNCWASNNYGWPNLAINNTPGSKLQ